MAATAATPNYLSHEVKDEVDFMTMFTNQNDDSGSVTASTPNEYATQQHMQPQQHAMPQSYLVNPPTLPNSDPLQVFDAPAAATAESWMPNNRVPMAAAGMAYPPQFVDMYGNHSMAHHQYMPQHAAPVPQYVQPALALPNSRPASAPTAAATAPAFSAFAAAPPAAEEAAATPTAKPVVATTSTSPASASPTSAGHASPTGVTDATSTETRQIRRKRKLTPEDKRRICEIYRNSQGKIRQEDIAKEYSVDRSTISKILNQEERWLDPEQPNSNAALARRPGGRYPAIEEEMHRWLDHAVHEGREVRDAEAREEALKIGLRLGHPHFQASSKWWDGVKRRRVEEGRAMPTTRRSQAAITPSLVMPGLVRSYSAMTMDAMPREMFPGHPGPSQYIVDPSMVPVGVMAVNPMQVNVAMRARSQSSPQVFHGGYAQQPTQFGPAPRQRHSPPRHTPVTSPVTPLSRNRSYHGDRGSPQRPSPLHRANSTQGRPSPHQRLGASAFGLTPVRPEQQLQQQQMSPTVVSPSEQMVDGIPVPGSAQPMSPLSVSVSEGSDGTNNGVALSPSTPRTPAQAAFGPDQYLDLNGGTPGQPMYVGQSFDPRAAPMMYAQQPAVCYPAGTVPQVPYGQPMYTGYEQYVHTQW